MSSFWESLGESIGYGLATVVLGPAAALERRARLAMREALLLFCRDLQPLRLAAPRGTLRRSAQLPLALGVVLPLEIEVDLKRRVVRITAPLERLPAYVEARIGKSILWIYPDLRMRLAEPKARSGAIAVWTQTLEVDVAQALADAVAGSQGLDSVVAIEIVLQPERIDLHMTAPQDLEAWAAAREVLQTLVTFVATRWPPSYR